MRVAVVSHAFVARENRKNLAALTADAEVCAILPHRHRDTIFPRVEVEKGSYRRISLPNSQYLLLSADLGFRRFRPDIIHVEYEPWCTMFWQVYLAKTLFARRAKLVCTVKNNTYQDRPGVAGRVKKAMGRFMARRVDRFVAVNSGSRDTFVRIFGVAENRISFIHHLGVDVSVFAPPGRNGQAGGPAAEAAAVISSDAARPAARPHPAPVVVGYCGRFHEEKGLLDLVSAVELVRKSSGDEIVLRCLGAGPLEPELKNLAVSRPWLEVLPPVPHHEVPAFMQGLDIFVLPSHKLEHHEEHDAHALLEAMAAALPSIGSNSGITPEILGDGSGLIHEAASVASLASALSRLASDADLRAALGSRGRQKVVSECSIESVAAAKLELYREVLSAG